MAPLAVGNLTLSVIMPNYNHSAFIAEALEAILTQSYSPLEVIVVDDASTDHSIEIIEDFQKKYSNIRLVRNPKNIGHLASVNKALLEAKGDFVHLPAADDVIFPGLYEKSMKLLEKYPNAGLSSALGNLIDKEGHEVGMISVPIIHTETGYIAPNEVLAFLKKNGLWAVGATCIWNRKVAIEALGYIPELGNYADSFLSRVLVLKHGACFIPEVLASWRYMETGFAGRMHADLQRQIDIVRHAARILKTLPISGMVPPTYAKQWAREWMFDVFMRIRKDRAHYVGELLSAGISLSLTDQIFLRTIGRTPLGTSFLGRLYHFCFVRKQSLVSFLNRKFSAKKGVAGVRKN